MTPEELNRTIEFIVQSQARLAAAQEQDRIDRLESEKERVQAENELKAFDRRLARLFEILVDLQRDQTERLNRFEEEMRENRAWQRSFQIEAIGRLDRILEKLTDRLN